jgi:hypothetical protein
MIGKLVTGMPEIVDIMRHRREVLNISFETLDVIAGVDERYSAKVLSPNPLRGLGYMSMGAIAGAMGLSFIVVENPLQIARVQHLWIPRKRPQRLQTDVLNPSALNSLVDAANHGGTTEIDP